MSVSEQAAQWWTLLHSEGVTAADHREFGEWVARSPERVEAYLEMTRLMEALESGKASWPATPAHVLIAEARAAASEPVRLPRGADGRVDESARVTSSVSGPQRRAIARRLRVALSVAAVLAGVIIGVAWFLMPVVSQYTTRFGEQRSILLEDGSRVTLNTASQIDVQLKRDKRTVRLLAGEALFEVAHDPARPFEVHAGTTVLRAVGTEFNVDLREKKTTVTVLEGRVAVLPDRVPVNRSQASAAQGSASEEGSADVEPLILGAAERLVITPAGFSARERVENLAAATAWTQRQLVFEHEPLSEVTEEFNRYSRQRIVIATPELARQEVTGVIQSGDPASFLSFLSGVPGVEIHEEHGSRIVTLRSGTNQRRVQ